MAARIDAAEDGPRPGWEAWLALLYVLGALVVLARLVRAEASVRRLGRVATTETRRRWLGLLARLARQAGVRTPVRLLRTRRPLSPMTWGILRPTILLPADADEWPEGRVRAVLLHELAHVARRDGLARDGGRCRHRPLLVPPRRVVAPTEDAYRERDGGGRSGPHCRIGSGGLRE